MVENYPGFPEGISGSKLGQLMHQQATKYGLETLLAEVTGIELKERQKVVKTTKGDFIAKAVIIASGSERLKLGIPGEKEFSVKGVSYCATSDAAFFREQPVAVTAAGDGATAAIYTEKFINKQD